MSKLTINMDELCYIAEQAECETADAIYALCKKYDHTIEPDDPAPPTTKERAAYYYEHSKKFAKAVNAAKPLASVLAGNWDIEVRAWLDAQGEGGDGGER